ncbi:MAG: hypothetical protein WC421_08950 [Elusimicrobiales bacterium]
MNRKIRVFALAAVAAAGLCAVACAQEGPDGPPEHGRGGFRGGEGMMRDEGRMLDKIAAKIGISDEKAAKMKSLREARSAKMKQLGETLKTRREAMLAELKKSGYSEDAVRKLQAEAQKTENELDNNRLEGLLEIRKLLSDDEFKKLMDMLPRPPDGPGRGMRPDRSGGGRGGPPRDMEPRGEGGPGGDGFSRPYGGDDGKMPSQP